MPFSSMGDDLGSRSFWAAALHVVFGTFANAWCSVLALLVMELVRWAGGSAAPWSSPVGRQGLRCAFRGRQLAL